MTSRQKQVSHCRDREGEKRESESENEDERMESEKKTCQVPKNSQCHDEINCE